MTTTTFAFRFLNFLFYESELISADWVKQCPDLRPEPLNEISTSIARHDLAEASPRHSFRECQLEELLSCKLLRTLLTVVSSLTKQIDFKEANLEVPDGALTCSIFGLSRLRLRDSQILKLR